MKWWMICLVTLGPMLALGVLLMFTADRMPLPSRPPTGNHGQGQSPARGRCPPGTREFWVDTDDGGQFFLECQR